MAGTDGGKNDIPPFEDPPGVSVDGLTVREISRQNVHPDAFGLHPSRRDPHGIRKSHLYLPSPRMASPIIRYFQATIDAAAL